MLYLKDLEVQSIYIRYNQTCQVFFKNVFDWQLFLQRKSISQAQDHLAENRSFDRLCSPVIRTLTKRCVEVSQKFCLETYSLFIIAAPEVFCLVLLNSGLYKRCRRRFNVAHEMFIVIRYFNYILGKKMYNQLAKPFGCQSSLTVV